ncbi:MAG: CYTH domain-containing protein [Bacteroidaceae bacterium]|nr:CYTH domain-containing protein [Bacteroidaceae bacterium]
MAQEIERKFLVKDSSYKQLAYNHTHIAQGYIASGNGRTVRIRIRDDRAYLTIKGPSADGGLSRYEFETEVAVADARDLMQICQPGIVQKTRWLVRCNDGHVFEVDEFEGDNEGLVMAEVELGSADEAYEKPDFIGREVTGDHRFYNSHLRSNPFKLWGKDIKP